MDPLTAILLLIIAFFFLQSGALSNILGGPSSGGVSPPPQGTPVAAQPFNTQSEQEASKLASAIPVVGGVLQSIIGFFTQASQQRAAEARDENSAIAAAVPQWDQMVVQIVAAYNRGQMTNTDVINALQSSMDLYWTIVEPHVQPGRDGCFTSSSGSAAPSGPFGYLVASVQTRAGARIPVSRAQQLKTNPGMKACGGTWGGGCCVAYADLWASIDAMTTAVNQNWNTGKPAPAVIAAVYPSKYGGISRPQYTVTFARP